MGYNAYKNFWTPVEGEELRAFMEPDNIEGKFAVAIMKKECLVAHLPKGKTGRFAKT